MRLMLRATLDTEKGNEALRSGRLPQIVGQILERLKSEAAYFTADRGSRTVYLFLDVADSSDMPAIAEPFFMELNASVEFLPVMNADELRKGLQKMSVSGGV